MRMDNVDIEQMAVVIDASDKPLIKIEEDRLDRKYLVRELCLYLTEPNQNESWRVALLGSWGSGKTSVCNWFRQKAENEGHIVVQYSSWSAKKDTDLLYGLYTKIEEALKKSDVEIGKSPEVKNLAQQGEKIIKQVSPLFDVIPYGSQVRDFLLSQMQSLSLLSKDDIKQLISPVSKDKKIIVIIDDLDRVEKSLIPRFLLFLRDLMDIKGISFLLPFDEKIVAHALREYSTHNDSDSREYGENFIDKIIDYSVSIPETSNEQYFAFFQACLELLCPFAVLGKKAQLLQDVLPPNPRKIKRLVRQIKAYEQEAQRHRPSGEIDGHAVTLVELLRAESYRFTELFFDEFLKIKSPPYMPLPEKRAEHEKKLKEWFKDTFARLNISRTKQARIRVLCENIEEFGRWTLDSLRYAHEPIKKSENLTKWEFNAMWDCWLETNDFKETMALLDEYAQQSSLTMTAMVYEFISKLTGKYSSFISTASQKLNLSEQEKVMDEAQEALALFDKILDEGHGIEGLTKKDILHFDHFRVLWNLFMQWVGVVKNPADKDARVREEEILKKWLKKAQAIGMSSQFYYSLKDYIKYARSVPSDKVEKKREALCVRLLRELDAISLAKEATVFFRQPDRIAQMLTNNAQEDSRIQEEILNPDSALWLGGDKNAPGFAVLLEAEKNHVVQTNAFELLAEVSTENFDIGQSSAIHNGITERIFKKPAVIIALWNACVAQQVQAGYFSARLMNIRKLCSNEGRHKNITKSTIEEKALIVPEWLEQGAK